MDKAQAFQEIVESIKSHTCSLRAGATQPVVGAGNINSPVVFIGEAPGKKEDEIGLPFVGSAGKVLAEALNTIGWEREDIYITNVVKCRPPNNRDPLPEDVEEHRPFLTAELELIQPKLIVLLGRHALQWFMPGSKISEVRGTAKRRGDHVYFPTYHPAATLYDPRLKQTLIDDIKKIPLILKKIDELAATPEEPVEPAQPTIFD